MKDTKRRMELFSFYDHTGIEAHLEQMAERGWLLEKIGNFVWRYRRVEPQKLAFNVCYFPKASMFDPGPSEEQETFYDFCAHTGWTLAAASAQMQVFYNGQADPVPIHTDPALEVEAIHSSSKKAFLLSQLALMAMAPLQIGMVLWQIIHNPIQGLSNVTGLFDVGLWSVLFLMLGVDLATYFIWRHRAKKAAEQGEFLATRSHPTFQAILLAMVAAGLAWWLVSLAAGGSTALAMASAAGVASVPCIVLVANGVKWVLKRNKVPANTSAVITQMTAIILAFVAIGMVTGGMILATDMDGAEHPGGTPLLLSDLVEASGNIDQYTHFDQSPLLASLVSGQYLWRGNEDGTAPEPLSLDYTVAEVRFMPVYDICRDYLLYQYDTQDSEFSPVKYFAPTDPAPWGAEEAYQFVMDGEAADIYLLCYPERVVKLTLSWEPTPEQMGIVGEKLGGA